MATVNAYDLIEKEDYKILSEKLIGTPNGNPAAVISDTDFQTGLDRWIQLQKDMADVKFARYKRLLAKYKAELDNLARQMRLARQDYGMTVSRLDPTPVSWVHPATGATKEVKFPDKYDHYRDLIQSLRIQKSRAAHFYNIMQDKKNKEGRMSGFGKIAITTIGLLAAGFGLVGLGKWAKSNSNSPSNGNGSGDAPQPRMEQRVPYSQPSARGQTWGIAPNVDPEIAAAQKRVALKNLRAQEMRLDSDMSSSDYQIAANQRFAADHRARQGLNDPLNRNAEAVRTIGDTVGNLRYTVQQGTGLIKDGSTFFRVAGHGGKKFLE